MSDGLTTILAATSLVHLALALAMFAALRVYGNRIPGPRYWVAASATASAGYAVFAFAPPIPPYLMFVVPNALMAASVVNATLGAAALSGRRVGAKHVAFFEAASAAAFIIGGCFGESFFLRSILTNAINIMGSAVAAWFLFFPKRSEDRPVSAIGAVVFSVFALFSAVRLAFLAYSGAAAADAGIPRWYLFYTGGSLALQVGLGVSFYLMIGGLLTGSLERSLRENKFLLVEMRHRTKNNIALIGSLVSLQGNGITDPKARAAFVDLGERLKTITTVYRLLSAVEDGHKADIKTYLESLGAGIRDTILAGKRNIALSVSVESRMIDADKLVQIGLIVNELATNAIKHAFAGERAGKLRLEVSGQDGDIRMSFSDDGVGLLPKGGEKAARGHESLGITLVEALAGQLKGKLQVRTAPDAGTAYVLVFPA